MTLPISFDRANEVRATTYPLKVAISFPRPLSEYADQMLDLQLRWLDEPQLTQSPAQEPRTLTLREPVREEYQFAALQPGRYQLAIIAPGAARAEKTIDVRRGRAPVRITLGPASTIRARVKVPDFEEGDELPAIAFQALRPNLWPGFIPLAKLHKNGKEVSAAKGSFDRQTGIVSFSNVPLGKYQLRVLSGEDLAKILHLGLQTVAGEPANTAWDRADLSVEVRSSSPAVIEAGDIRLKKVRLPAPP